MLALLDTIAVKWATTVGELGRTIILLFELERSSLPRAVSCC
jgi:hypothetical protein